LEILTLIPPSKKIKQDQLFEVHKSKKENLTVFGDEKNYGDSGRNYGTSNGDFGEEYENVKGSGGDLGTHETSFPSLSIQQHFTPLPSNARTSRGPLQPEAFPSLPVIAPLPSWEMALQNEEEESKGKNHKNKKTKKVLVSWG